MLTMMVVDRQILVKSSENHKSSDVCSVYRHYGYSLSGFFRSIDDERKGKREQSVHSVDVDDAL